MRYDVAIIGCSTAGLYAAERLAAAGQSVAVFDRRSTIGEPRRTLIVTPDLAEVLDVVPEEATLNRIRVMELEATGERTSIELEEPDLIVERGAFITHWADRACVAGAEIHLDARFHSLTASTDGAELTFGANNSSTDTVHAKTVIGADGVNSRVARTVGIDLPPRVPIAQAEVAPPSGWDQGTAKVWFDDKDTQYFYWLIPESPDRAVVGLIGDQRHQTRPMLDEFLRKLELEPLEYQSAKVAMYHPKLKPYTRVGQARVYLVGDAAGHVKVSTVGGLVSGLWGARGVADHIAKQTPLRAELRGVRRELSAHWYLRFLLERFGDDGYQRLIRGMTPATRRVLSHHNRDRFASSAWRLVAAQPSLVPLALKALFSRPHERETLHHAQEPTDTLVV